MSNLTEEEIEWVSNKVKEENEQKNWKHGWIFPVTFGLMVIATGISSGIYLINDNFNVAGWVMMIMLVPLGLVALIVGIKDYRHTHQKNKA